MWFLAVGTVEARPGVTAVIQQQFEHRQRLHSEQDGHREGGRLGGDLSVGVGAVLQQQCRNVHPTKPDGDEQRVEDVEVGVSSGLQQHLDGLYVPVVDGGVNRRAPPVLVHLGVVLRQLGVDVEARLNQQLHDVIPVVLCGDVQRTDAAVLDFDPAGRRDQQ